MSLRIVYAILIGILILWILVSWIRPRRRSNEDRISGKRSPVSDRPYETVWPAHAGLRRTFLEDLFDRSLCEELNQATGRLLAGENKVIRLYFGLDREEPLTLEEIGRQMGLSAQRVRAIRDKAISRLRDLSLNRSGRAGSLLTDDALREYLSVSAGMTRPIGPAGWKSLLIWLPPLEREVASRYLGWKGEMTATIGEIAASLNLSIAEVRRIRRMALVRLRRLCLLYGMDRSAENRLRFTD